MPIVTVSRQYGAGGSAIAAAVADALRWRLLDNAIVDRVAERLGIAPREVERREERVPSLGERLAEALTLGAPEALPAPGGAAPAATGEERLLAGTARVLRDAAAEGPIVVVGRGAQLVLGGRDDALHVLCYAPRPVLIERIAARQGVSPHEAARLVDETNRRREQYAARHWGRRWLAPEHYHLCLNTGWLGLDGAAHVAVLAAREKFGAGA